MSESDDVDNNTNESDDQDLVVMEVEMEEIQGRQRQRQPKLWCILLRYMSAATLAVALTVSSPDTRLWQSDGSVHMEYMFEVFFVYVLTLVSLASVFASDPGFLTDEIVARVCQQDGLTLLGYEENEEGDDDQGSLSLDVESCSPSSITRRTRNMQETEALTSRDVSHLFQGTRRKVCETCGFAPPLRSHHCKICDKCVATFDHHCIFIGTCIGERNHCRFWFFLSCQLLGFWVCSHTVSSSTVRWSNSGEFLVLVVAKLYLYPLAFVAALMWITHTVFAIMNLTTFECGKSSRHIDYLQGTRPMDLPFSQVC